MVYDRPVIWNEIFNFNFFERFIGLRIKVRLEPVSIKSKSFTKFIFFVKCWHVLFFIWEGCTIEKIWEVRESNPGERNHDLATLPLRATANIENYAYVSNFIMTVQEKTVFNPLLDCRLNSRILWFHRSLSLLVTS